MRVTASGAKSPPEKIRPWVLCGMSQGGSSGPVLQVLAIVQAKGPGS